MIMVATGAKTGSFIEAVSRILPFMGVPNIFCGFGFTDDNVDTFGNSP